MEGKKTAISSEVAIGLLALLIAEHLGRRRQPAKAGGAHVENRVDLSINLGPPSVE